MSRSWLVTTVGALVAVGATLTAQSTPASGNGALRAAYLNSNPAHVVQVPGGEPKGVAVELARELARRRGVTPTLMGLGSPQAVIDAVRDGKADIGFVAYNPERAGPVDFSQVFLLVQQTFLVAANSQLRSIADIDRPGRKIGATRADSIALYLRRNLKQAELVELEPGTDVALKRLADGTLDAFGANRQRLTTVMQGLTGVRLLPDDLYGVEQTIIVPAGRKAELDAVNQFLDEMRRSGFIEASIERSGVIGITVAPAR